MSTTLTALHRKTAQIIGAVVHGKQTVTIQIHGKDAAKIIPVPVEKDRKKAVAALFELGKVWREAGAKTWNRPIRRLALGILSPIIDERGVGHPNILI